MSARTRIKAGFLNAIERGEFEQLPGAFFTRAFLRSYARELRLPPDEIVGEYDATRSTSSLPPRGQRNAAVEQLPRFRPVSLPLSLPSTRSVWPIVALALLFLVVMTINRPVPGRSNEAGAVGTIGVVEARPPVPAVTAVPDEPTRLIVEIRPSRPVWVTATADGQRVIYRLLQPGERVSVESQNDLNFRVGDAGAFEYSINGVPAKAPGASGEVREFAITRENYRALRR